MSPPVRARRPDREHLRGDSRARVGAGDRLDLRAHGPEPGDRLLEHGGIEPTPSWRPWCAAVGRTVSTSAVVHVLVSGLATGSIYALMALSLVIAFWPMGAPKLAPHGLLGASGSAGPAAPRACATPLGVALVVASVAGGLLVPLGF